MLRSLFMLFLMGAPALLSAETSAVPVLEAPAKRIAVNNVAALVSALGSAAAGQAIMLADGTYDLSAVAPLRLRKDSVFLYGASRNPDKVILKGAGFGSANTNEELIKIEAKGVTLAYFTLRDGRANGVKLQTGGNDNVLIHNLHFTDICERSIKGPDMPVSRNGIVRYSVFEQATAITSVIPNLNFNGDYIAGMDMMKIEGWRIHDNTFKNIRGMNGGGRAAVFLWNGCKGVTVERNTFIGCDRSISFGNPSSANVDMDGGVIGNNFIVAGKDASIEICNSTGSLVANNTIYSANPAFTRTIFFYNSKGPNSFKNNLVLGALALQGGAAPDTAGNLLINKTGLTTDWFRDIPSGDLHLKSGAFNAIDKGVPVPAIKVDIDGGARDTKPDIGADELGSGIGMPLSPTRIEPGVPGPGSRNGKVFPADQTVLGFLQKADWFSADGRRLPLN